MGNTRVISMPKENFMRWEGRKGPSGRGKKDLVGQAERT